MSRAPMALAYWTLRDETTSFGISMVFLTGLGHTTVDTTPIAVGNRGA